MVGRPSNRDAIIDAAEQLVAEQGAAHLTFDALCQETGISKGGLLYHFANKNALLAAMLERMVQQFDALRAHFREQLENDPRRELKSILLASLNSDAECAQLSSGMLAVAANNPELLEPLQEHVRQTFDAIKNDTPDPQLAELLFFSVHGARLFEQLQLCQHCQADREQFAQKLMTLVDSIN
ncbi:TetR/AcrR family transcriptional regulator [Idiomarina sp. OT37-5b]|jgi:AcrR family transcriptional regulator|uniref:TetR/AcrR family transcriptional regulator n=1 Tax=Idiomarina aquatica TaxID=1327752 RepID=A0AA94EH27_9GAMM|nr:MULTISPECIES: TetR/AcrR family transcriptional regulator [Idiomarina]AVJ55097.1 TetR/AcrR family transcriptional regulator [Idiomarina sp. OT37-5b]RUO45371.1 TetR/AcrR family transcriptional regulator [Idiomarina aquatica]